MGVRSYEKIKKFLTDDMKDACQRYLDASGYQQGLLFGRMLGIRSSACAVVGLGDPLCKELDDMITAVAPETN